MTEDGLRVVSSSGYNSSAVVEKPRATPNPLTVWSLETGKPLLKIAGHGDPVAAVAVTRDGQHTVSASWDTTLKVWDLASGAELHTLSGHTDHVTSLAITPDDNWVVSGSDDGTVRIWNLRTGEERATLIGHTGRVTGVAVTFDGRYAISTSDDQTLRVWDLEGSAVQPAELGHLGSIMAVEATADGRRAISGSADSTLRIWDVETGKELCALAGHRGSVTSVAVTLDGRLAFSGSLDMTVKSWDLETRTERFTLWAGPFPTAQEGSPVQSPASEPPPDGLSSTEEPELQKLEAAPGDTSPIQTDVVPLISVEPQVPPAVTAVGITPDGRFLVFASADTPRPRKTAEWVRESDSRLVTFISLRDSVKVCELKGQLGGESGMRQDVEVRPLQGRGSTITALAITGDGQYVIGSCTDCRLRVWNLQSGVQVRKLRGHGAWVSAVAVTPDGLRALSGSRDDTLKLWDLRSGNEVLTLKGHTQSVRGVAFMPDGRYAVSTSSDHTLKLWDLTSGRVVATFTGDVAMQACVVALDGKAVVAGDQLGQMHFLQLEGYLADPGGVSRALEAATV